jgi:putative membrane protein
MVTEMNLIQLFAHWIVSGIALALTAALLPGFRLSGFTTALFASLVIGVANIYLRPVLIFLTFPLTILTLGFFILVVDALILRLCAAFLKGFEITNWISAILGGVILAITSSFLHWMLI